MRQSVKASAAAVIQAYGRAPRPFSCPQVHSRETTWFKPEPPLAPMRMSSCMSDSVNIETDVVTHHIPISANI